MTEQTQTPVEPIPGSPEYDQQMAQRYRESTGRADPSPPQRPEHIPEKFWDAEKGETRVDDLARSYTELERSSGSKQKPNQPAKPQIATGEADDPAKGAVENAGLDWDTIVGKVSTTGTLEEADFAALEKAGVPKAIVEGYLEAMAAASEAMTQQAYAHVGGEDKMSDLLGWAAKNLSQDQIAHYNSQLAHPKQWRQALDTIDALRARAMKTSGEPNLVGERGAPSGPSGYRSKTEMRQDMSDPRYQSGDPVFHAEVRRKMQSATWDLDP